MSKELVILGLWAVFVLVVALIWLHDTRKPSPPLWDIDLPLGPRNLTRHHSMPVGMMHNLGNPEACACQRERH